MKDLLRLKTSLNEEIERILNEQVKVEAHSSAIYLAMSSWCDDQGFDFSAGYFAKQADEERHHMLKLFNYINDRGGKAISPEIVNVPKDFESFRSVFELALEQEMHVTAQFNNIAEKCFKVKDFVTFQFIQWFLAEQIEEEYVARRILEMFDVIGEEGTGRWEIDKHIPKVSYNAE
ncbi:MULTISPECIES: ferritin [Olivibacter]|jgi:ferritin|uniref:Ferritin n=3 Tax=Sphingobacteriaceae TaxID=84566 RepID=F4CCU5_SPHS2|nr:MULTISPECIES: ferritin [unclassified Olivibacter]MCL4637365.1 ferritin [Olivibacter sp. UJ_SKK_5.1]MDM8176515.1 ferritin [Olivibacter sp. 47]MDX3916026.1 ferritin [Pseudosphingobacterium sp.]QEL00777.1 ferritin [Olivibacter sp. LS-1]